MTKIYYDSKTGNVGRFVRRIEEITGWATQKTDVESEITERGHLITFTTRFGEIPESTRIFMERSHQWIDSVSSSGNRNWGRNFGAAGDLISKEFGIPLLLKFELSGTNEDVNTLIKLIQEFNYGKERYCKKLDITQ